MEDKIKRQYIPMREWDGVAMGMAWFVKAEVDELGHHIDVTTFDEDSAVYVDNEGAEHKLVSYLLKSSQPGTSTTWEEAIKRDICEQAAKLKSDWRIEYYE